jgi:endonuclease III related protein
MRRRALLLEYYHAMLAGLGPSGWWPGQTPFEIALGAILTQNTAWTNVEKALHNLRAAGLLDSRALFRLGEEELGSFIRPSGFFRIKAARVRNFLQFLDGACGLDVEALQDRSVEELRPALLGVSGIGPETADSILLYALGLPSFVVDAYTRRIFSRHGLIPEDIGYEELREFFMDALPPDAALFNEYHALIVRTGKGWCAKREGKCPRCPLLSLLTAPCPLTCVGKSIIPDP